MWCHTSCCIRFVKPSCLFRRRRAPQLAVERGEVELSLKMFAGCAFSCKHLAISQCFALQRLLVIPAEAYDTCWHSVV